MNRRETIVALVALGAAPLASEAQQPAKPAHIAVLAGGSPEGTGYLIDAFKKGMRELGYIEGKNVVFEIRWALGRTERMPDLARELVALKPDVIFTTYVATARAVQQATNTIPIVVATTGDPVANGFGKSLARPGGNVTGLTGLDVDISPKLLELLLTVVPKLSRVAVLWNPSNPNTISSLKNLQAAAQSVGMAVLSSGAQTPAEIESAFARVIRENVRAVVVLGDGLFVLQRRQIVELIAKNRLASVFQYREDIEAGGLLSYGENLAERFRRAAIYVDKILKGAKPGDLPIEQPTTFELVVNLKTAKALGLTIPRELLLRADRVIE